MASLSATLNPSTIMFLNSNMANHMLALTTSSVTRKKLPSSHVRIIISIQEPMHLPEKIILPNIFKATFILTTQGTKLIPPSRSSAIGPTIPIFWDPESIN